MAKVLEKAAPAEQSADAKLKQIAQLHKFLESIQRDSAELDASITVLNTNLEEFLKNIPEDRTSAEYATWAQTTVNTMTLNGAIVKSKLALIEQANDINKKIKELTGEKEND